MATLDSEPPMPRLMVEAWARGPTCSARIRAMVSPKVRTYGAGEALTAGAHLVCGLVDQVTDTPCPGREFPQVPALEGVAEERPAEADGKGSGPDPARYVLDVHPAGGDDLDVRERAAELANVAGADRGGRENLDCGCAEFPAGMQFRGREAAGVDGHTAPDAGRDDVRVRHRGDDVGGAEVQGRFRFVRRSHGPDADFQGVAEVFLEAGEFVEHPRCAQRQFDAEHTALLQCLDDRGILPGVRGPEDGHHSRVAEDGRTGPGGRSCPGVRGAAWVPFRRWLGRGTLLGVAGVGQPGVG